MFSGQNQAPNKGLNWKSHRLDGRPTSLQKAPSAVQTAVPALIPELIATLQQAEAHRLPQRLGQTRFPATQPLLPPGQSHLLALLKVGLPCRRLIGERTRQKHQGLPTCQPGRGERKHVMKLHFELVCCSLFCVIYSVFPPRNVNFPVSRLTKKRGCILILLINADTVNSDNMHAG